MSLRAQQERIPISTHPPALAHQSHPPRARARRHLSRGCRCTIRCRGRGGAALRPLPTGTRSLARDLPVGMARFILLLPCRRGALAGEDLIKHPSNPSSLLEWLIDVAAGRPPLAWDATRRHRRVLQRLCYARVADAEGRTRPKISSLAAPGLMSAPSQGDARVPRRTLCDETPGRWRARRCCGTSQGSPQRSMAWPHGSAGANHCPMQLNMRKPRCRR